MLTHGTTGVQPSVNDSNSYLPPLEATTLKLQQGSGHPIIEWVVSGGYWRGPETHAFPFHIFLEHKRMWQLSVRPAPASAH